VTLNKFIVSSNYLLLPSIF